MEWEGSGVGKERTGMAELYKIWRKNLFIDVYNVIKDVKMLNRYANYLSELIPENPHIIRYELSPAFTMEYFETTYEKYNHKTRSNITKDLKRLRYLRTYIRCMLERNVTIFNNIVRINNDIIISIGYI